MNNVSNINSTPKLLIQSCLTLLFLICIAPALLFLTAGTFSYWNVWLLTGTFFVLELYTIIHLCLHDPALLQKRLQLKENEKTQQLFNIFIYIIIFLSVFIIPALDFKHNWSSIPLWIIFAAVITMIIGLWMVLLVMKQNKYSSRNIEIQEDQKVIDTGLYAIVRHPMYIFGIIAFCSMPLILGSVYAFLLLLILCPLIFIIRILNEEKVLKENLKGYQEYTLKVKYRLIPFVW
ncbi:MAG: isoprenylcysteine carboxylmethyltransferase family protein [Bacteroidales bacterium]|jgi:protein-S-isoprenylcysteine O-methyltransferase Ste14|nr:isoprenylcysteine carboxylmethyltransferase family protein [Bacteroidales bacterium]